MKCKAFFCLLVITTFGFKAFSQSNGYRMEFNSVVTLSTDTVALPVVGADRIKSFTVPIGCVLKITAGMLTSMSAGLYNGSGSQPTYIYQTILTIDNNKILGEDRNGIALNLATTKPLIINGDSPIWVPEGKTVTLTSSRGSAATSSGYFYAIANCWISGVVFKLVAN